MTVRICLISGLSSVSYPPYSSATKKRTVSSEMPEFETELFFFERFWRQSSMRSRMKHFSRMLLFIITAATCMKSSNAISLIAVDTAVFAKLKSGGF